MFKNGTKIDLIKKIHHEFNISHHDAMIILRSVNYDYDKAYIVALSRKDLQKRERLRNKMVSK